MVVNKSFNFECLKFSGGKYPNKATKMTKINLLGLATGSTNPVKEKWFKRKNIFCNY